MNDPVLMQKLQVLLGERGRDDGKSAARIEQLRALVAQVTSGPTAKKVAGTAPTKAEVDAIIDDVEKLYAGFNALRQLL